MFGLLCEVLQLVVFKQVQLITLHKICVTKITNCINVHRKSHFGILNRYLNPLLSFTGLGTGRRFLMTTLLYGNPNQPVESIGVISA